MDEQLDQLEAKITLLIQASVALRAENQQLREQLTQLQQEHNHQTEKIEQVRLRLCNLLEKLPEDDDIITDTEST